MTTKSYIPIQKGDLEGAAQVVTSALEKVAWNDSDAIAGKKEKESIEAFAGNFAHRHKGVLGGASGGVNSLSLTGIAQKLSNNTSILNEDCSVVLNAVLTGMSVGVYIAKQYYTSSGLAKLHATQNSNKKDKEEYEEKRAAQARIFLHVAANFITWTLEQYKSDEAGVLAMNLDKNPKLSLSGSTNSMKSSLYFYAKFVEQSGRVNSSIAFVKATLIYFERVLDIVESEVDTTNYTDFFTSKRYKLSDTDFVIEGFERSSVGTHTKIEVRDITMDDIIANREFRKTNMRQVERMLCYDPTEQRNPWQELGGLSTFAMSYGPPGTGKSMGIAATYNYGFGLAENIGVQFKMLPLPKTLISGIQGETAGKVQQYFRLLRNPNVITYAPWDDIENLLKDRSRQGASEGEGHIISGVLTETEGATAVNHGNYFIQIFSNYPGGIDAAILSRVQSRTLLGGPTTYEDFMALDYLWYKLHEEQISGLIGDKKPLLTEFEKSMQIPEFLANIEFDESVLRPEILEIAKKVDDQFDSSNDPRWAATFQDLMSNQYDFWTARESRNVQSGIDLILMDFDMEKQMFEKRSVFFDKSYEERVGILKELKRARAKEVDFYKIWRQEMLKHASSLITIKSEKIDQKIAERTQDIIVQKAAVKAATEQRSDLFQ